MLKRCSCLVLVLMVTGCGKGLKVTKQETPVPAAGAPGLAVSQPSATDMLLPQLDGFYQIAIAENKNAAVVTRLDPTTGNNFVGEQNIGNSLVEIRGGRSRASTIKDGVETSHKTSHIRQQGPTIYVLDLGTGRNSQGSLSLKGSNLVMSNYQGLKLELMSITEEVFAQKGGKKMEEKPPVVFTMADGIWVESSRLDDETGIDFTKTQKSIYRFFNGKVVRATYEKKANPTKENPEYASEEGTFTLEGENLKLKWNKDGREESMTVKRQNDHELTLLFKEADRVINLKMSLTDRPTLESTGYDYDLLQVDI